MKHYLLFTLFLSLISSISNVYANDQFPYRDDFSDVSIIELTELEREYDDVYIIDVRSRLEFNVLHMDRAVNIPMSTRGFELEAKSLISAGRKVVIYCNGHSCKKSYEASQRLKKIGLFNVHAFDAGIFDWTRANPDKAVLLGVAPVDVNKILSDQKLKQHSLSFDDFIAGSKMPKTVLLDVRDHFQRKEDKTLEGSKFIPLDRFHSWVIAGKDKDKALYIFDAAGKQVRWLQYYLESQDRQNYYFLKGGINNIESSEL